MDKRTAQIVRHADRWDGQTYVQAHIQIDRSTNRHIYRQKDKQTDRQMDKRTGQKGRHADRWTDIHMYRHTDR
jgi:hypothetical protein